MKRPLSRISALHYCKLVFRAGLFLAATAVYLYSRLTAGAAPYGFEAFGPLLAAIWLIYAAEMLLRFFPSSLESMGCQKQFARNFLPAGPGEVPKPQLQRHKTTALTVAALWALLNAVIGALYFGGLIDREILFLISLAFAVCDMICILFFCPFQTLMMKNKCCGSCRIYNWDYAMMFTPLVFVKSLYTWSLLGLSLLLLLQWEITYHRHPQRFSQATNGRLACAHCKEKLCSHKKSLQKFLRRQGRRLRQSPDPAD